MFWSLTYREFQIKHAAFTRSEDRQRALMFELAEHIGQWKDNDRDKLVKNVNVLRKYPVKRWILEAAEAEAAEDG